jgi:hypothetical protein
VGDGPARLVHTEGKLKVFQPEQLDVLERLTANGPVPIAQLPREFTPPLLSYLATFDVYKLARACDRFIGQAGEAGSTRCRYGKNRRGDRQFFFPRKDGVTFEGAASGGGRWDFSAVGLGSPSGGREMALEVDGVPLRDAAGKLPALVRQGVEIRLDAAHPARRARPTLRMSATDPADLLNAFAAAYGLRWMWDPTKSPRKVLLVSKRDYVGTPAGLRQALLDALPAQLRDVLVGSPAERTESVERPLKRLSPSQLDRLERLTAEGTLPVGQLPAELTRPILEHLAARSALTLGLACDRFFADAARHPATEFRYWMNPFGTKQFDFERGNSGISVAPD